MGWQFYDSIGQLKQVISTAPAGVNTLGMSNLGNTSGTTGAVTGSAVQFLFAGGNNVTLSQSINGASGTITVSAFNQSNQSLGLYAVSNTTQSSSGTVDARTLSVQGAGIASVGISNGSLIVSVPSSGGAGTNTLGMSNIGNTSGDTAIRTGSAIQFVLAGGNNVTLSQSTNGSSATVTVSARDFRDIIGMSNLGNTSGTTGIVDDQTAAWRYYFAGGNNVTLSQSIDAGANRGTLTISAFNQTVESNTIGMSNLGNTSGTTGVVSNGQNRYLLAGGNNITLSQSLNGASGTVTISAANQTNQTLGLYAVSNTTQSTSGTVDARTLSFQGAGIASVGVSNGSVIISVPSGGGAAGTNTLGMSNIGNTSGDTSIRTGSAIQLVLAGGNNITLSQSTNGSSATITISASANTTFNSTVFGKVHHFAQSSSSLGQNSVYLYPEVMHEYVSGSIVKIPVMLTASSSAAAAQTRGYTFHFGVYTRHNTNSTVLTRHYSTSYTASVSQNSNGTFNIGIITAVGNSTSYNTVSASSAGLNLSASIHGARELLLPFATNMPPGEYWIAMRHSSSSAGVAGAGWNISHIFGSSSTQNRMGVSINSTNVGIAQNIGMGVYSATSGALPDGISMTQINQSAVLVPVYFLSNTV